MVHRDPGAAAHDRPISRGSRAPERASSLRSTWGDGLLLAGTGLLVLYCTYVYLHAVSGDEHGTALAWVDGLSGGVAVAALAVLVLRAPDRGGRLLLTILLAVAAGSNALAHLWLTQDLVNTVLVLIVLLVVVTGVTSTPAAVGLVLGLWVGWLAVTDGLRADEEWGRHLSDLLIATFAGTVLHLGRRLTMQRLLRAQQELARLSEHDDLTGLANRRGFFASMRQAMVETERRGRELVVLYCDVDGLKQVNDSRGHEAGDLLLVEVARRLREQFPDARCVARLGGDEFGVVLLCDSGAQAGLAAVSRAQRVRDDAAEEVWSLSVGAASSAELRLPAQRAPLPSDPVGGWPHLSAGELVGAVVGLADERMYEAKRLRPRPSRTA